MSKEQNLQEPLRIFAYYNLEVLNKNLTTRLQINLPKH